MTLSRLSRSDATALVPDAAADAVFVVSSATARYLIAGRELLASPANRSELEDILERTAGAGAPVFLADLSSLADCGEVRHEAIDFELRVTTLTEIRARFDQLEVGTAVVGRMAGANASDLVILADRQQPQRPALRRLLNLPSERCSGLLPFLTAVGAEPQVVLDDLQPLVDALQKRGEEWVAVVAKAGAFLWRMDLRGRQGLECQATERIDRDVILPLTAGLEQAEHILVGGRIDELIGAARAGAFDLAFIMPVLGPATLGQLEAGGEFPAFSCDTDLPLGLKIS